MASSYVGAIRFNEPAHLAGLDRNEPALIWHRMRRIGILCGATVLGLPLALCYALNSYPDYVSALRQLGLFPGFTNSFSFREDIFNIAITLAKISALYMGPIANYLRAKPALSDFHMDLWSFRDHVFAPVTEELIYRGAVIAVLQPVAPSSLMWSPLLFGLAHVHHGYHLYCHDKMPGTAVLTNVTLQFAYTTVFGMLANHFFLQTHENLWCPIVVHAVCNALGFPSFDMDRLAWFWVYCGMLVSGVVVFIRVL